MNTLPGTESTVTPLITFAGYNTTGCTVTVNDRETPQVTKVKYLSVFLFSNSGILTYQMRVENFVDSLIHMSVFWQMFERDVCYAVD